MATTMKFGLRSLVTAATAALLNAASVDTIPASGGDITIVPMNHATLQLRHAGKVIDVDPVAQANFGALPAPALILVTDIHGDHLDPATITKLRKAGTVIVGPAAATGKLEGAVAMANGEKKTEAGHRP